MLSRPKARGPSTAVHHADQKVHSRCGYETSCSKMMRVAHNRLMVRSA